MRILFFSLLLIGFGYHECEAQANYALLVGVGNYLQPKDWPAKSDIVIPDGIKSLRCPENDIELILAALNENFSDKKLEPLVLKHEQATRKEITAALQSYAARCGPEDTFIFYYSGHGAQLKNTRSKEADQLDEVLLPYDAILKGKLIRDKEIRDLLSAITAKGTEVIALFDCCHSGSMTRDVTFETKAIPTIEAEQEWYTNTVIQGDDEKLAVLSAARSDELAMARSDLNGPVTSIFTKSLVTALKVDKVEGSLDGLLRDCQRFIDEQHVAQHPVLDASFTRRKKSLFGKQVTESSGLAVQRLLPANRSVIVGEDILLLSAGAVVCDSLGSTCAEVIRVISPTEAEVQFTTDVKKMPVVGSPMRIRSLSSDMPLLKLYFSRYVSGANGAECDAAMNVFEQKLRQFVEKNTGTLALVDSARADYLIHLVKSAHSGNWMLERIHTRGEGVDVYPVEPRGTTYEPNAADRAFRYMESVVSGISRYLLLLNMRGCADYAGELSVSCNGKPIEGSEAQVKLGDAMLIAVKFKEGVTPAQRKYVYVVGLSQTGSSVLLYPPNGSNAENYLPLESHKSGDSVPLCQYTVSPPSGVDHVVMLALDAPLSNPYLLEQPEPGTRAVADAGVQGELPNDQANAGGVNGCTFHCSSVRLVSKD